MHTRWALHLGVRGHREGSYNIKGTTIISDSVTGRKPKEIEVAVNGAIKAPVVAAANVSFWQGPWLSGRDLGNPGDVGGRRFPRHFVRVLLVRQAAGKGLEDEREYSSARAATAAQEGGCIHGFGNGSLDRILEIFGLFGKQLSRRDIRMLFVVVDGRAAVPRIGVRSRCETVTPFLWVIELLRANWRDIALVEGEFQIL
ncbi:hypothetical protein E4U57_000295 [Claviceps arundinis]|uniref:Uncharacterized protein n=1 Tax=Claviceps arundinis TaxID=1623583 RepID=A0ABQ7PD18_9HYPO|nr:hypothetical protein E4U57_000295 [Claviceps arundinis]